MAAPLAASILGMGSAFPAGESLEHLQSEIKEAYISCRPLVDGDAAFAAALFDYGGVHRRGFAVPLLDMLVPPSPVEANEMLAKMDGLLLNLQKAAAEAALAQWGGDKARITHVLYASASRSAAPSLEVALISALGLPDTAERVSTDHQGALSSARLLNLAATLAAADPARRILVLDGNVMWGVLFMVLFRVLAEATQSRMEGVPASQLQRYVAFEVLHGDAAGAAVVGGPAPGLSPGEEAVLELRAGASLSAPLAPELFEALPEEPEASVSGPTVPATAPVSSLEVPAAAEPKGERGRPPAAGLDAVRALVQRLIALDGPPTLEAHQLLVNPECLPLLGAVETALALKPSGHSASAGCWQLKESYELLREHGCPVGGSALLLAEAYARGRRERAEPGWAIALMLDREAGAEMLLLHAPHPGGVVAAEVSAEMHPRAAALADDPALAIPPEAWPHLAKGHEVPSSLQPAKTLETDPTAHADPLMAAMMEQQSGPQPGPPPPTGAGGKAPDAAAAAAARAQAESIGGTLRAMLVDQLLLDDGWPPERDAVPLIDMGVDSFMFATVLQKLPREAAAAAAEGGGAGGGGAGGEEFGTHDAMSAIIDKISRALLAASSSGPAAAAAAPAARPQLLDPGHACVLGLASAFPPAEFTYDQSVLTEALIQQRGLDAESTAFTRSCFEGTEVARRGLSLPLANLYSPLPKDDVAACVAATAAALAAMQTQAAAAALAEAGVAPGRVTHLLYGDVSGKGFAAHVQGIAASLGLSQHVRTLVIDHMGCLGGYRALALAGQIAAADPSLRVLLVYGDLSCGLGISLPPKPSIYDLMGVALFADGAAAAVVGRAGGGPAVPGEGPPLYEIISNASQLLPKSQEDMYMKPVLRSASVNQGLIVENMVSARVPQFVAKYVEAFAARLTRALPGHPAAGACGLLVHPGGKTILEAVQRKLGAGREQLASAWAVMREHGNISGATNLMVMDHFRKSPQAAKHSLCLALSFGPGLGMEGLALVLHGPLGAALPSGAAASAPAAPVPAGDRGAQAPAAEGAAAGQVPPAQPVTSRLTSPPPGLDNAAAAMLRRALKLQAATARAALPPLDEHGPTVAPGVIQPSLGMPLAKSPDICAGGPGAFRPFSLGPAPGGSQFSPIGPYSHLYGLQPAPRAEPPPDYPGYPVASEAPPGFIMVAPGLYAPAPLREAAGVPAAPPAAPAASGPCASAGEAALDAFLRAHRLERYAPQLAKLGVCELEDLREVTAEDLARVELPIIKQRVLLKGAKAALGPAA